jgi:hypothetical protein
MIKCSPPTEVEDNIRKQAAKLGVPLTQYLNPFLAMIAAGTLTLTPQLTPALPTPTK